MAAFFERSSVKGAVALIVSRAGVNVAYQRGHTLAPILTTFIPRLLWHDKPSVETGLLFNDEFHIAEAVVYISPSYLGELYWNFGWPGALIGLLIIGLLLGYTSALCDLSRTTSVSRLLVLAITIFELGVRFEGSIATECEVWVRSLAGILLLHLFLARRDPRSTADGSMATTQGTGPDRTPLAAPERFPNLMT
jgi:hypothetical protein